MNAVVRVAAPVVLVAALLLPGCFLLFDLPDYYGSAVDLFDEQKTVVYVAPWGHDTNPGTASLPFQTIQVAINAVRSSAEATWEVRVAAADFTPGNGLVSTGRHGLMVDYDLHQPQRYERDMLPAQVVLSFGWDRLFRTNDQSDGGGVTRLYGGGVYSDVLFAVYQDEELLDPSPIVDNPGGETIWIEGEPFGGQDVATAPNQLRLEGAFIVLPEDTP